jgi:hypothetical protein
VWRALPALLSIIVCAWFVVGARQAQDTAQATALLSAGNRIDRAGAARVSSLLQGAGLLNPDRQVDILRAQLADERGAERSAERILRLVLVQEPLNLDAWDWLARSATDAATLRLAYAKLGFLEPPVRAAP